MDLPSARRPIDPAALAADAAAVRRLARSLVGESGADDVAQEAMRTAIERPPPAGFLPFAWLAGVTKNVARVAGRGDRRRRVREARAARPEAVPSTADAVARLEERRRVVEAVLALPEPHRSAVALRWFDGLPPREVARRQGVPVETARTRLKRALRLLRTDLERRHGGDRRRSLGALAVLAWPREGSPLVPWGGLAVTTSTKATIAAAAVVMLVLGTYVGVRAASRDDPRSASSPETADASPAARLAVAPPKTAATAALDAVPAGPRARGRVTSRTGAPLRGSRVTIGPADARGTVRAPVTMTDADGRFTAPFPAGTAVLRVRAEADGFAPEAVSVRPGDDVEVRLDPLRRFPVRVLDAETDTPVAGARVDWAVAIEGDEWAEHAVTDATGTVTVPDAGAPDRASIRARRGEATLSVTAAGYAVFRTDLERYGPRGVSEKSPYEVGLVRGTPFSVRVIDADTKAPVAGARVRGWCGGASPVGVGTDYRVPASAFTSLGETTTDAGGTADLLAPTKQTYVLAVAETSDRIGGVSVREGRRVGTIAVRRSARVAGRTVDGAGAPLSGVRVEGEWRSLFGPPSESDVVDLGPADVQDPLIAITGADGRFEFRRVVFGRRPVAVGVPVPPDAPRFASVHAYAAGRVSASAQVAEPSAGADPAEVELRLLRDTDALTFRVKDEAGRPVAGALVMRVRWFPGTRTDADGVARLQAFPNAAEATPVHVAAKGFAEVAVPVPVPAKGETFDVVLHPAREVDVRVTDAAGNPVLAGVQVWSADAPAGTPPRSRSDARRLTEGETDADGHARFEALPRGPLVAVVRPSFEDSSAVRVDVPSDATSVEARTATAGDDSGEGSTVEVEFLDRSGAPVSGASAVLLGGGTGYSPSFAGKRVRFRRVHPGSYEVQGWWSLSQVHRRFEVRRGEDVSLRLRDEAPGSLVGTLEGPDGPPAGPLRVSALEAGPGGRERTSGRATNGRFTIEGIPPGSYVLRIHEVQPTPGRAPLRYDGPAFTVSEGERVERAFALVPGARLWIRCDDDRFGEDLNGKAVKDDDPWYRLWRESRVGVQDAAGEWVSSSQLTRGRRALPAGLAPGAYRVSVHTPLGGFRGEVRVEGTRDAEVEVRLDPDLDD